MHRIKTSQIVLLAVLTLALLSIVPYSYSGVPQLINYQGKLTTAGGSQVPDGSHDVEFKMYDVATGGPALWTETWNSSTSQITTKGGVFNAMLGKYSTIPATFFSDHTVTYLGITVGTDSEMAPRQRITSVGYAFEAGNGVPKGFIGMWSGSVDQIPAGWALCDGTNGTPDLRDRFIVGSGNTYNPGATGGEASHVFTVAEMPSHNHTDSGHAHTVYGWNNGGSGSSRNVLANTSGSGNETTVNGNANIQNTGGGQPHNNLPPYYSLAFIMKR